MSVFTHTNTHGLVQYRQITKNRMQYRINTNNNNKNNNNNNKSNITTNTTPTIKTSARLA